MYRSSLRAIALAIYVTVLGVQAAAPTPDGMGATAPVAAVEDVRGAGWKAALACLGCAAGGFFIVATGGLPGLWVAANTPGSAIALAGCIAACANM